VKEIIVPGTPTAIRQYTIKSAMEQYSSTIMRVERELKQLRRDESALLAVLESATPKERAKIEALFKTRPPELPFSEELQPADPSEEEFRKECLQEFDDY